MTGKQMVKELEKAGWKLDRIKGSHHIMKKNGKTIPVPCHRKELGKGLEHTIRKEAGL